MAKVSGIPINKPGNILKTACQQTCPADAITFGDIQQDANSDAATLRRDNRAYLALGGAPEHGEGVVAHVAQPPGQALVARDGEVEGELEVVAGARRPERAHAGDDDDRFRKSVIFFLSLKRFSNSLTKKYLIYE